MHSKVHGPLVLRADADLEPCPSGALPAFGEGTVLRLGVAGTVAPAPAHAVGAVVADRQCTEAVIHPGDHAGVAALAVSQGQSLGLAPAAAAVRVANAAGVLRV